MLNMRLKGKNGGSYVIIYIKTLYISKNNTIIYNNILLLCLDIIYYLFIVTIVKCCQLKFKAFDTLA